MKLEQLQQFSAGCVGGEIQNNAWHPLRFPAAMQKLYCENEGSRVRMECSSGVRLRFVSDTQTLRLALRYGAAARPVYKGALLVDGEEYSRFGADEAAGEWQAEIFAAAEKRRRLFDLWLPHLCRADVLSLQGEDGAHIEAAPSLSRRWLAYGDSITQGMVASTPLHTHTARCAAALDAEVLNLGVGGAKLEAGLADAIPDGDFDFVSIAYGTNDFIQSVPVREYSRHARRLLENLRAQWPQTPIVLITPLTWANRREPNERGETLDDFRAALAPVAEGVPGTILVPGETLLPDDEKYFVDSVHPSDAGFAKYAANLLPHLQRAVAMKNAPWR